MNGCLIHKLGEESIPHINNNNSIQPENDHNKSKLHFNRYGTIVFANSIYKFLFEYY